MKTEIAGYGGFVYGEFEYRLLKISGNRVHLAYRYEDETLPSLYRGWHETRMALYSPYSEKVEFDKYLDNCPVLIEQIQQLLLAN